VLQLKRGWVRPADFKRKYGVDVLDRFEPALGSLASEGWLAASTPERITLTRAGLLRVDLLLPRFFLPEHTGIRYT